MVPRTLGMASSQAQEDRHCAQTGDKSEAVWSVRFTKHVCTKAGSTVSGRRYKVKGTGLGDSCSTEA